VSVRVLTENELTRGAYTFLELPSAAVVWQMHGLEDQGECEWAEQPDRTIWP
jgi:hypothetical protein